MPKPVANDPLAILGLTQTQANAMNLWLQQLQEAEEEPYPAMDAMMGQTNTRKRA